ncbi:hypothetical protein FDUTEX481_05166 [Tolypothrix sp. PCC 7601]|nr:hypothetical protein FDUTEX481_05166 [Tolypothrix sp. PCC 7601]
MCINDAGANFISLEIFKTNNLSPNGKIQFRNSNLNQLKILRKRLWVK